MIDSIVKCCPWIKIRRRPGKRNQQTDGSIAQTEPKKKRTSIEIDQKLINASTQCEPKLLESIKFKDNLIGKYEVNVMTLLEPPSHYMARNINRQWVDMLKKKLLQQPRLVTTVLPVLIDPSEVKVKEDFIPENLASYNLWTLGGNHIRTALQEISKESALSDMRRIQIHLYCGLSEDDAIQLGNIHNGSCQTLKLTFQDYVQQAVRYREAENLWQKVKQMLTDIEMRDVPKESVGTIVSVVKYTEGNMNLVKNLFFQYQQKYGYCKSIPQTLFRELQGVRDVEREGFLKIALNHGIETGVKEVKKAKKKAKLEACFKKVVECEDMAECNRKYPEHVSQIEKYLDLDMNKGTVPEVFLEFCESATTHSHQELFEPEIKIDISIGQNNISNLSTVKNVIKSFQDKLWKSLILNEVKIINEMGEKRMKIGNELDCSINLDDSGISSLDLETQPPQQTDFSFTESELETQPPQETDSSFTDSDLEAQPPQQTVNSVTDSYAETQPPLLQSQDLF